MTLNNTFNQKIFDYFIEKYNIALLQDEMSQIKKLCYGCWIDDLKNQESETLCFWLGSLVSELEKRDLLPQKITEGKECQDQEEEEDGNDI